ncbi:MAG: oligosaccharide flippase family protein [Candidatus Hydrogenedentes bacterium]|nr:oligosaccharide flippase family protein [Candidatus Hydrogenedentota bacterium]
MGQIRRTLGHTLVYALGLVVNRGAAYALIPMYTRTLPQAEIGVWELATATTLFLLPFLDLGMSSAVLRYFHVYETDDERRVAFNSSLCSLTVFLVIAVAAVFFLAKPLAELAFGGQEYARLMKLTALLAAITALSNQPLAWLRTQERSLAFAGLNLVRGLVGPAAICILVLKFDMGVEGVLWGDLAGLTMMTVIALVLCRRWLRLEIALDTLKPMLAFALPMLPLGIASPILTISDRYFVENWSGKEALAILAIGTKVGVLMQFFTQAFQTAYPPAAFQIDKRGDAPEIFSMLLRLLTVGLACVAVALSALGPELVQILAPKGSYGSAYQIVPFIAFTYVLYGVMLYVMTGLAIVKRMLISSAIICSAAVVKVILNVILIGPYGNLGAAAGTLGCHVFGCVLAFVVTQRVYPVPYDIGKLLLLSALAAATTVVICFAAPLAPMIGLPIRLLLLALFTGVSCFAFVTSRERREGRDIIAARVKRIAAFIH